MKLRDIALRQALRCRGSIGRSGAVGSGDYIKYINFTVTNHDKNAVRRASPAWQAADLRVFDCSCLQCRIDRQTGPRRWPQRSAAPAVDLAHSGPPWFEQDGKR